MKRRHFVFGFAPALRAAAAAKEKFIVACVGVRGRAGHLLQGFAAMPDVEIAMLCDID